MTEHLPPLFEPAVDAPRGAERWVATEHARGPWDPRACHGGPVAALLTRALEHIGVDDPGDEIDWQLSRLTIELTRPVPVGHPLDLSTRVERPGRKVSLVAATLASGEQPVAIVRGLRIRRRPFDLPPHEFAPPEITIPPEQGRLERPTWAADGGTAFHVSGVEHRSVEGGWEQPGPIQVWIRLRTWVVPDEEPSGLQRTAAAADFGNGVSAGIPTERFTYINPDLTIHVARDPVGEWIGLAAHSVYGTASHSMGTGFAESALHDADGRFGRSAQSLLVDPV